MTLRTGLMVAMTVSIFGPGAGSAVADQLRTTERNYTSVRIETFGQGRIQFRDAQAHDQAVWIDDVELVLIERGGFFDEFGQAERFIAGGQYERAVIRYRRALRTSTDPWTDLVAARLVRAADAAGQLDVAISNFIVVLRGRHGGPATAARIIPERIPHQPTGRVGRAMEQLDQALATGIEGDRRALLTLLRYEILRHTDAERARAYASQAAQTVFTEAARTERVYRIQLTALRAVLGDGVEPTELVWLDRAIRDCPPALLPALLVAKGDAVAEIAQTREDHLRATWPYLRVAVHFPKHPRAADGLLGAARLLHEIGAAEHADRLLDECLHHPRIDDQTRRLARAARRDWRDADGSD